MNQFDGLHIEIMIWKNSGLFHFDSLHFQTRHPRVSTFRRYFPKLLLNVNTFSGHLRDKFLTQGFPKVPDVSRD